MSELNPENQPTASQVERLVRRFVSFAICLVLSVLWLALAIGASHPPEAEWKIYISSSDTICDWKTHIVHNRGVETDSLGSEAEDRGPNTRQNEAEVHSLMPISAIDIRNRSQVLMWNQLWMTALVFLVWSVASARVMPPRTTKWPWQWAILLSAIIVFSGTAMQPLILSTFGFPTDYELTKLERTINSGAFDSCAERKR